MALIALSRPARSKTQTVGLSHRRLFASLRDTPLRDPRTDGTYAPPDAGRVLQQTPIFLATLFHRSKLIGIELYR